VIQYNVSSSSQDYKDIIIIAIYVAGVSYVKDPRLKRLTVRPVTMY